ncbi:hypothetical protein DFH09DRAFT_1067780 [Mycena vulgaris]|nr:hypothetical protein DFH09DRAFT_1067780 [Mycena vulgaris]
MNKGSPREGKRWRQGRQGALDAGSDQGNRDTPPATTHLLLCLGELPQAKAHFLFKFFSSSTVHPPQKRGRPKKTTADKANDDEEPAAKKPKQTEKNKRKALEAPVGSAAKRSRSRELPPRSIANPERYQSAYGNSARHIYCIPYGSLVTSLTRGAVEEDDHRIFGPMVRLSS